MAKTFEFKVKIEMHTSTTRREAYAKLKSWLEHNGHTSAGHGFAFQELANVGEDD